MCDTLSTKRLVSVVIVIIAASSIGLVATAELVKEKRSESLLFQPQGSFVGEYVAVEEDSSISRIAFDEDGDCALRVKDAILEIPGTDISYVQDTATLAYRFGSDEASIEILVTATVDDSENQLTITYGNSKHLFYQVSSENVDIDSSKERANLVREGFSLSRNCTLLRPEFGYAWTVERQLSYAVKWQPNTVDTYRNLVASEEEGEWGLLPGYAWDVTNLYGIWNPGMPHPRITGLAAAKDANTWIPEQGHTWKHKDSDNLETVRVEVLNATAANNVLPSQDQRADSQSEEIIQGVVIGATIGLGLLALDELLNDSSNDHHRSDGWAGPTACHQCGGKGHYYEPDGQGLSIYVGCSKCWGSGKIY